MRCHECGGRIFLCTLDFKTENPASLGYKGVLSGFKFEILPGTLKPKGSYYLTNVTMICSKCNAKYVFNDPVIDLDEELLVTLERYGELNVYGSNH